MDILLESWMASLIELAKIKRSKDKSLQWTPDQKLKLAFMGYNGSRNTGSDVRVEEILRQFHQILGPKNVDFSIYTHTPFNCKHYFKSTKQIHHKDIFPPNLYKEIAKHHGVIGVEGSLLKSKFSNALTTLFIGSMGLASAQNGLSLGYGAEAGHMDSYLQKLCKRYCNNSLIITRNKESQKVLNLLGMSSKLGTDTAWTFEPKPKSYGAKILKQSGWDSKKPIITICPINPFWWPVKPSFLKYILKGIGPFKKSHLRSIYFHKAGRKVDTAFTTYLHALAKALNSFMNEHDVFPIIVGMEALDKEACMRLSKMVGNAPTYISDEYDMFELVSILRNSNLLVSSRFHAIVNTMPALVPAVGVTMDERIRNIMNEGELKNLYAEVTDPDLAITLHNKMNHAWNNKTTLNTAIGKTVVSNIKTMADMGKIFEEYVLKKYPDFPMPEKKGWFDYLPPLSKEVHDLIKKYE